MGVGCPLALALANDVWWGRLVPRKAQRYARLALESGTPAHPDLVMLSKLGTDGRHAGNCKRDLISHMKPSLITKSLHPMRLPVKEGTEDIKYETYDFLPPHALFSALYHEGEETFTDEILGGDRENVPKFWATQTDHPMYKDHPMHSHELDFRTKAVGLAIHNDDVPALGCGKSWAKLAECNSWSSVLARGPTEAINFCISFFFVCMAVSDRGRDTFDTMWKHIAWSLLALYNGYWPTHDADGDEYTHGFFKEMAGEPLAGGYFGVMWILRNDLDAMFKRFHEANYNSNANPCNLCGANASDTPWTDCRLDVAKWLSKIWTNASHKAAKGRIHRLFGLPGMGITAYLPDILHSKHLGTDPCFFGAVIKYLTHHLMNDGADPDRNLQYLFGEIKAEYRKQKVRSRYTVLTRTMVHPASKKIPQLKGKGATIKSLGPVLSVIFARKMDTESHIHVLILQGIKLSTRIDTILDDHQGFYRLPTRVAKTFQTACFDFCRTGAALVKHFHKLTPPVALFNYTIKNHYVMHMGLVAQFINPSLGSCYQGEGLMQVIKQIIKASANGATPKLAANTAIKKYAFALTFGIRGSSSWKHSRST